jgi:hypothetical protein
MLLWCFFVVLLDFNNNSEIQFTDLIQDQTEMKLISLFILLGVTIGYGLSTNVWACPSVAECDASRIHINPKKIVPAIQACLNALAVSPDDNDEMTLFHYGNSKKIDLMKTKNTRDFLEFNTAFTRMRELRIWLARSKFSVESDSLLTAAQEIAADFKDISELKSHRKDILDHNSKSEQNSFGELAFELAWVSKIYPMVFDYLKDGDKITKRRKYSALEREGMKAAIKIPIDGKSNYASTFGMGVYLATNSKDAIGHFTGGYSGLVCDVPRDAKIVDLEDACVKSTLISANILMNEQDIITGYNQFVSPVNFEKAAQGLIIRFKSRSAPYLVDKGAINYQSCRDLSMSDFQDCDTFSRLLNNRPASEGSSFVPIPGFLKANNNFRSEITDIIKSCISDCSTEEGSEIFKGLLKNIFHRPSPADPHEGLSELYTQGIESDLQDILQQCGCSLRSRSGFLKMAGLTKKNIFFDCKSESKCRVRYKVGQISELFGSVNEIAKQVKAK